MNEAQLQGNWHKIKGKIKNKWGKLTDDDLLASEGNFESLIGKLTDRYGITKDEAIEKLNHYLSRFNDSGDEIDSVINNLADIAEDLNEKTHELAKNCQEFTKNNPLLALGVVASLGLVIGLLISR